MPRYALRLEFNGAAFSGTSPQSSDISTQEKPALIDVLNAVAVEHLERPQSIQGASRLDSGVSARAFIVHLDTKNEWEPRRLGRMLNTQLPDTVVVTAAAAVSNDWHAMRSSSWKTYSYTILERGTPSPLAQRLQSGVFIADYFWQRHLPQRDQLEALAGSFVGEHDWSAFACLRHDESDDFAPTRTIRQSRWTHTALGASLDDGILHRYEICGNGFLYKQVRAMVGAQLCVASGTRDAAAFYEHAALGRSVKASFGNIAPAQGLCLEAIECSDEPDWDSV